MRHFYNIKNIRKAATILGGSLLFLPLAGFPQSPQGVDPPPAEIQVHMAPVKVDGKIIFYVRGSSSMPAEQRAETISDRITTAARDHTVTVDSVKLFPVEGRIRIFAGKHLIINLYDADANREGIQLPVLAEIVQQKIQSSIELFRHDRSRPVMVKNLLYAGGALVLLVASLFLMLRLLRWLHRLFEQRIKVRFESMENKSYHLIQSGQLWKGFHILFRVLKIGIIVILLAGFLQYILGLFPWTNQVAAYTLNLFLDPIVTLGLGFLRFLPKLAFLIIIYFVTRYLLKLIKLLFTGIQGGEISLASFRPEWAMPTYKILRLFVIVFAVILAYPYIPGSDSNAFKGISVFLGVLLSLGSSSFIGNLIAGYSMTYRGAFHVGDRIQVEGQVGFVEEQKLLVTRLRSLKNEEIVIPNSILLNSNIINFSTKAREGGVILHTTVGIGYETSWRQVEAMLTLAASRTEGLLKDPPPYILQKSLGDFAVTYELNVYCNDVSRMNFFYTRLHQNILDVFNENNVQIMTPAYEGDPEVPKVVPVDQWNTPLAKDK